MISGIKSLVTLFFLAIIILGVTPNVLAEYQIPEYPLCTSPVGQLKVRYENGLHAIPGETQLRNGSDDVYWTESGNAIQCFCAPDGSGVQTNWLKLEEISHDTVSSLVSKGWIFVPNGADWGLDAASYMAKNTNYTCQASEEDPEDKNDNPEDNKTDNQTGGSSSGEDKKESTTPSPTPTPQVASGVSQQVLGLADAGGNSNYLALASLGLTLISGGLIARRKKNAK